MPTKVSASGALASVTQTGMAFAKPAQLHGDRRSVEQNRDILSATQANARAIDSRDRNAVTRAEQAVDPAQRQSVRPRTPTATAWRTHRA